MLEGLAVALANIDRVIALIRAARSPAEARVALRREAWPPGAVAGMLERAGALVSAGEGRPEDSGLGEAGYRLSERQAQAILDLRLHRLTSLEQDKILHEYDEILRRIADLLEILEDPERMKAVVRDELVEIKAQYADPRRTEIVRDEMEFDPADLVSPGEAVVTFSHWGYVKWQPVDVYAAQKRGGKGKTATTMKEADFIDRLFVANTHDQLLCFSNRGKVYWLRVYELPPGGRTARGSPVINLLPALQSDERISAVLPVKDFNGSGYVLMATERGLIKKTLLSEFSRPRSNGIIAIDLLPADRLIGVAITDGEREVMLASSGGRICRFHERQVRSMGRTARGVIGMRISERERIISLIVAGEGMVLTATENGYGKCTRMDSIRAGARRQGRHLHSHRRAQWRGYRCARGRTERRDHAHDRRRQAGTHPGCRGQRARAQHPGSEAHSPRFGRTARGSGAGHRGGRRQRLRRRGQMSAGEDDGPRIAHRGPGRLIERLCIVGVGLIGGSLARDLKALDLVGEVVGSSRRKENLERARALGVIDRYDVDTARAVRGADLVLVAVPLGAMSAVFRKHSRSSRSGYDRHRCR